MGLSAGESERPWLSRRFTPKFGECPKYIQARGNASTGASSAGASSAGVDGRGADAGCCRGMVTTADTLFIATASGDMDNGASSGVLTCHTGATSQVLRVDSDGLTMPTLLVTVFSTLGNIMINPRAGLLSSISARGPATCCGYVEIIWDGRSCER
jgi:hypothetical protein